MLDSRYFLHRTGAREREGSGFSFEVFDRLINQSAMQKK
jgi:hypothetical protein